MSSSLTKNQTILLLRHSERPPIKEDTFGNDLSITKAGREAAYKLGKRLASGDIKAPVHSIHSSPVKRCIQTGEEIIRGLDAKISIVEDSQLGDPGPYIKDAELAGTNWGTLGFDEVCKRLFFDTDKSMPGFHNPKEASLRFYEYLISQMPPAGKTSIFITHDIIIAALSVHLLDLKEDDDIWPDFLEGIKITASDGNYNLRLTKALIASL